MNTPHTSQDRDVKGQDEDDELSRREGRDIEGKEGSVLLVTNASISNRFRPLSGDIPNFELSADTLTPVAAVACGIVENIKF